MFEEGELLYFEPFIFPDGGAPKNKNSAMVKGKYRKLLDKH